MNTWTSTTRKELIHFGDDVWLDPAKIDAIWIDGQWTAFQVGINEFKTSLPIAEVIKRFSTPAKSD